MLPFTKTRTNSISKPVTALVAGDIILYRYAYQAVDTRRVVTRVWRASSYVMVITVDADAVDEAARAASEARSSYDDDEDVTVEVDS